MSTTFWAKEAHLVKPARNEPPRFVTSLVKFRHVSMAEATRFEAERKAAEQAEAARREAEAAEAAEEARLEAARLEVEEAEAAEAARLEAEAARFEAERKAAEEAERAVLPEEVTELPESEIKGLLMNVNEEGNFDLGDLWKINTNTKNGNQNTAAKENIDRTRDDKILSGYPFVSDEDFKNFEGTEYYENEDQNSNAEEKLNLSEDEKKEIDTNVNELARLVSTNGDQESIEEEKLESSFAEEERKEQIGREHLNKIQTQLANDSYTWKPISVYLDIQRAANKENANCRLTADGFLMATKDVSENQELLLPPYEALSVSEIKEDLKTTKGNLELFNNILNQNLIFKKESEGGFWDVVYEINTKCERPAQRKGRGMGMYALERIEEGTVFDWIFLREEANKVEPGKNEYDHDSRVAIIYYPFSSED